MSESNNITDDKLEVHNIGYYSLALFVSLVDYNLCNKIKR